jgi:hypothetical protein
MKFDEQELEAIVRLQLNPDFGKLLGALGRHAEQLNEALIMRELDSGALYQMRGETRGVTSILRAIAEARQRLENIQTHREPNHE